ncbi:hypothetical protein N7468_006288 [Penicillium chermesinum]|uniref:F-box domain-containing protein n=1 Tax=Penicillium chermesinum TaxID=63820 RepID=A0A9W9TJI6_9EURO|nr:uncharacterized protein N7468_006288 [Penicillium chermesinum]KAJ5225063.1 hypothetical protein N7468_006288 [Penicillium chermesinum]
MSPNLSAAHQRGQRLYRNGDFEAAVEAFGEALSQQDGDKIGILDNRCAALCKLEKYDQALRDARLIIKSRKEDERGYLRCGQVLVLQKKPEKALEIYAYGLKSLPAGHPRRETLELMQKKLQNGLMLNRHDPFTILPLEMAIMVLDQFSFRQIAGIMRVCKGWQRFIHSLPHLWLKMDFTGARTRVPWPAVRSYVRQSKGNLSHAVIKNLPFNSTQKSLEFVSRCPRIEHLELWVDHGYKETAALFRGFKQVKILVLGPDIAVPQDSFFTLLKEMRKLEHIKILNLTGPLVPLPPPDFTLGWPESLPNLRSIDLRNMTDDNPPTKPLALPFLNHPSFVERQMGYRPSFYPRLEELRLDWSPPKMSQNAFVDSDPFTSLDPDDVPPSLPPLRCLELRGLVPGRQALQLLPGKIESFRYEQQFPALHSLVINDAGWFTVGTLVHFLSTFKPTLRTLSLDACPRFKPTDFHWDDFAGTPELQYLTDLSLASFRDIEDKYATKLFEFFSDLKSLNLSSTEITGLTIRKFADARNSDSHAVPKLDRLIVKNCERISSDAVLYGREKGLDVVI